MIEMSSSQQLNIFLKIIILSERYSTAAGGKAPSVYSSIQGVFPCISL